MDINNEINNLMEHPLINHVMIRPAKSWDNSLVYSVTVYPSEDREVLEVVNQDIFKAIQTVKEKIAQGLNEV